MSDTVVALIAVLLVLQVKHFIFDYPLQTPYLLYNKGTYGHPGGIIHAGLHALGTTAAFLVVAPGLALGAAIVIGEFLFHYHVDWSKEQIVRRAGYKADQRAFWWAIGADQMVHQLSYLVIGGLLVLG